MEVPKGFFSYICYFTVFLPVFVFLFVIGIIKGAIFSPFVFLVIAFGDTVVVIGLWPLHLFWSINCIIRTKKFGAYMKCLLILIVPIPIALWTVIGVAGSAIMGVGYGFVWPVMETFRAISREGVSIEAKLFRCFTDGTWSCVWGACTIVCDFADFSFHSYFSVMDGLLDSKGEEPIELKKGWTLLGTVCVPFAALWILLWPIVVLIATLVGLLSSLGFGFYAASVAYQEESTQRAIFYVIASVSLFDEYTNDLLYLREGSCFPRPQYRERTEPSTSQFPVAGWHLRLEAVNASEPLIRPPAQQRNALKTVMVWDAFIKACEDVGKKLLRDGAIGPSDLEAWRHSRNKIVNIGIPAYPFLDLFFCSIKSGSSGFLLRDNFEITSVNRPEGRVFDWLYDPMLIMKKQIQSLNLEETEALYLYKHCLYGGDGARICSWENGGFPPQNNIKRAQLEGISRRLQGFCLTLSRLPTSRRRFFEMVKVLEQEGKNTSGIEITYDIEAAM